MAERDRERLHQFYNAVCGMPDRTLQDRFSINVIDMCLKLMIKTLPDHPHEFDRMANLLVEHFCKRNSEQRSTLWQSNENPE